MKNAHDTEHRQCRHHRRCHRQSHRRRGSRGGFTLAEIVIAIALTAALLTGLTMTTVNILGVWTAQAEAPLFDRHVDGLRRMLEECVAETTDSASGTGTSVFATAVGTAAARNATAAGNTGALRTASAVFTQPPSAAGVERAAYLRITGAPPVLICDTAPTGFIHAWLVAENNELALYWQTDAERTNSSDDAHRLLLSPHLAGVSYLGYNTANNEWLEVEPEDTSNIPTGTALFMRLEFSDKGQTRSFTLVLSEAAPHNLNY
ncbi:MAG: hypothetical protein LBR07_07670 [Puniceicoccales bacterium]|jgi:hypothetical protein|nr:hypothetical protein [Puniceicoccales bacterium]